MDILPNVIVTFGVKQFLLFRGWKMNCVITKDDTFQYCKMCFGAAGATGGELAFDLALFKLVGQCPAHAIKGWTALCRLIVCQYG